jgi:hypothetical protein
MLKVNLLVLARIIQLCYNRTSMKHKQILFTYFFMNRMAGKE